MTIRVRDIRTMATERYVKLIPHQGQTLSEKKFLVYKMSPLVGTNLYKMITEAATGGPIFKGLYQSKHC